MWRTKTRWWKAASADRNDHKTLKSSLKSHSPLQVLTHNQVLNAQPSKSRPAQAAAQRQHNPTGWLVDFRQEEVHTETAVVMASSAPTWQRKHKNSFSRNQKLERMRRICSRWWKPPRTSVGHRTSILYLKWMAGVGWAKNIALDLKHVRRWDVSAALQSEKFLHSLQHDAPTMMLMF